MTLIRHELDHMAERIDIQDIIKARQRIAPYVVRTPLHHYPSLDKLLGAEVYVKHENHQLLGAFKMRGGINLISQLSEEELSRGIATASTGNHGQSIAYAAKIFGAEAIVGVPENANPDKVSSMRNLGAKIISHGQTFEDSREFIERLSKEEGYRYVHALNEPRLVAGVGTYTLEIVEDLPDVELIIVPIGGGSGAAGACVVAKDANPRIGVIGVQSSGAPASYISWKNHRIAEAPMETVAEGLAVGRGYEFTQSILRDLLDDFILVSDQDLRRAVVLHLRHTHNLMEHAGAASLAAAVKIKDQIAGKKVVLVASGSNISMEQLNQAIEDSASSSP